MNNHPFYVFRQLKTRKRHNIFIEVFFKRTFQNLCHLSQQNDTKRYGDVLSDQDIHNANKGTRLSQSIWGKSDGSLFLTPTTIKRQPVVSYQSTRQRTRYMRRFTPSIQAELFNAKHGLPLNLSMRSSSNGLRCYSLCLRKAASMGLADLMAFQWHEVDNTLKFSKRSFDASLRTFHGQ